MSIFAKDKRKNIDDEHEIFICAARFGVFGDLPC